jgi:hypothetical protein
MNEELGKSDRKSEGEWVELMAAYEAGDLPQREFCKAQGVAYSSFGYWRRRLRSQAPSLARAAAPLVELSPLPMDDTGDWRVELELGGGLVLRLR